MKRKWKKKSRYDMVPFYTTFGVICGIISIVVFIILVVIATIKKGNVGFGLGMAGTAGSGLSILGLWSTIRGIKSDENMFFTFPLLGLLFNGIMILVYLIIYIIGIVMLF